jgi:hypothetical protein
MSDIIREVDEELRHERYKKLWDRYGIFVVGAALLVVLGVAGWRGYEWYQAREAAKASARFETALQLAADGKRAEAETAFNEIAKDGTRGYRALARFRAAAEAGRTDVKAGVAAFDAIAADTSLEPALRDIARVHAGYLLVDTASVPELTERLKALMDPASPFRYSANEILGLAHYRAGEIDAAQKIFAALIADGEVPPSMRNRMQVMNALVAGETGAAKPAAPAAPAATQ